jgi:hypothetical protein
LVHIGDFLRIGGADSESQVTQWIQDVLGQTLKDDHAVSRSFKGVSACVEESAPENGIAEAANISAACSNPRRPMLLTSKRPRPKLNPAAALPLCAQYIAQRQPDWLKATLNRAVEPAPQ